MMFDVYRNVCSLLGHWWSSDRIRVSPHEGQLLRIQPGDLLTVAGVDAEVVGRSLIEERSLCLTCHTAEGPAELLIAIPPNRRPVGWDVAGVCRQLSQNDIQIWQRCI